MLFSAYSNISSSSSSSSSNTNSTKADDICCIQILITGSEAGQEDSDYWCDYSSSTANYAKYYNTFM